MRQPGQSLRQLYVTLSRRDIRLNTRCQGHVGGKWLSETGVHLVRGCRRQMPVTYNRHLPAKLTHLCVVSPQRGRIFAPAFLGSFSTTCPSLLPRSGQPSVYRASGIILQRLGKSMPEPACTYTVQASESGQGQELQEFRMAPTDLRDCDDGALWLSQRRACARWRRIGLVVDIHRNA